MTLGLAVLALTAASPPELAKLAPFVGHCWSAELAVGVVDTHCFSPVFGGRHIRDVHNVRKGGRVLYQGETLYSAEAGAATLTYWSSLGGIGRGTVSPEGNGLAFSYVMRAAPNAEAKPMRSQWRWIDRDRYEVRNDGSGPILFRRDRRRP
jgi:hypothetical protein